MTASLITNLSNLATKEELEAAEKVATLMNIEITVMIQKMLYYKYGIMFTIE